MTSYKLLKITFVILLLVTLGELGYYVYRRDNITPSPQKSILQDANGAHSSFIKSETIDIYTTEILPSLMKLKKNNYQNFYFVNEERGYIKSLSHDDIKRQIFMEIANELGEKIDGYTLNNDKIKKAKFFLLVNGSQSPVTAEELKEGEKIIIRWWESLVDRNSNFVEYVVTR